MQLQLLFKTIIVIAIVLLRWKFESLPFSLTLKSKIKTNDTDRTLCSSVGTMVESDTKLIIGIVLIRVLEIFLFTAYKECARPSEYNRIVFSLFSWPNDTIACFIFICSYTLYFLRLSVILLFFFLKNRKKVFRIRAMEVYRHFGPRTV